jgi:hypothetical protein
MSAFGGKADNWPNGTDAETHTSLNHYRNNYRTGVLPLKICNTIKILRNSEAFPLDRTIKRLSSPYHLVLAQTNTPRESPARGTIMTTACRHRQASSYENCGKVRKKLPEVPNISA